MEKKKRKRKIQPSEENGYPAAPPEAKRKRKMRKVVSVETGKFRDGQSDGALPTPPDDLVFDKATIQDNMYQRSQLERGGSSMAGANAKFKPEYIRQSYVATAQMGATNEALAELFNVTCKSIVAWKTEIPEFGEAVEAGRDAFDCTKVEDALLKKALGCEFEEVKIEETVIDVEHDIFDPISGELLDTHKMKVPAKKTTRTKKHIPPSDTAIQFWLNNRDAVRWRNERRVQIGGTASVSHLHVDAGKLDLLSLTKEQLHELRGIVTAATGEDPRNTDEGHRLSDGSELTQQLCLPLLEGR